jgi:hypothetical protein
LGVDRYDASRIAPKGEPSALEKLNKIEGFLAQYELSLTETCPSTSKTNGLGILLSENSQTKSGVWHT